MSRMTMLPRLLNSQVQLGLYRTVARTLPRVTLATKQSTLKLSTAALEEQQQSPLQEETLEETPVEDSLDVGTLNLSPLLKRSLASRNITSLFSIQKDCFSHILDGKDLVGRARTGTGKTLAFSLPVIERLERGASSNRRFPRVLILAPTRELANQVDKEISQLSGSVYKTICIYGGSAYGPQENALRRGVDIVVGTPGRVQDMINKGHLNLSNIETLILDEADHMLDIGFAQDLEVIIQSLRTQLSSNASPIIGQDTTSRKNSFQFLLFSATVPEWIKKAINKYLSKDHIYIDHVGTDVLKTNASILQLAIPTLRSQTTATVSGLLQTHRTPQGRCIIFCETKSTCDTLANELGSIKGVKARALHGDVSQASRENALNDFRSGTITCLVATDVAARGLDISNVELVIQTEPPRNTETFIHRSGRTGRAGKTGTCVTLFDPKERGEIDTIRRGAGVNFKIVPAPSSDNLEQVMIADYIKQLNSVTSSKLRQLSSLIETNLELIKPEFRENATAALTAAFSALARSPSNVSKPRSLIDARDGFVTLSASGITRENDVHDLLYNQLQFDPSIRFRSATAIKNRSGIVFDVPSEVADGIVKSAAEKLLPIVKVEDLPELNISYGSSAPKRDSRSRFGSSSSRSNSWSGASSSRSNSRSDRGSSGNKFGGGNRSRDSFSSDKRSGNRYGDRSDTRSNDRSNSRNSSNGSWDRKPRDDRFTFKF